MVGEEPHHRCLGAEVEEERDARIGVGTDLHRVVVPRAGDEALVAPRLLGAAVARHRGVPVEAALGEVVVPTGRCAGSAGRSGRCARPRSSCASRGHAGRRGRTSHGTTAPAQPAPRCPAAVADRTTSLAASCCSAMNLAIPPGSPRAPSSWSFATSANAGSGGVTPRRSASKAVIWALQRRAKPMVRTPGAENQPPTVASHVDTQGARQTRCGGPRHRRGPLRHAGVGRPVHADLAVRPRLRGRPLDRVVAVVDIRVDGVEVAFRAVAAAAALDDHGVTLGGDHPPEHRHEAVPGAVRVAMHEDRMGPTRGGAEHVGAEPDAVAHRHHHVVLLDEVVRLSHVVPSVVTRTRRRRRGSPASRAARRTRRSPAVVRRRSAAANVAEIRRLHATSESRGCTANRRACASASSSTSSAGTTFHASPMALASAASTHSELMSTHAAACRPRRNGNVTLAAASGTSDRLVNGQRSRARVGHHHEVGEPEHRGADADGDAVDRTHQRLGEGRERRRSAARTAPDRRACPGSRRSPPAPRGRSRRRRRGRRR